MAYSFSFTILCKPDYIPYKFRFGISVSVTVVPVFWQ